MEHADVWAVPKTEFSDVTRHEWDQCQCHARTHSVKRCKTFVSQNREVSFFCLLSLWLLGRMSPHDRLLLAETHLNEHMA